jgi:hypothetical protein
MQAIRRHGAGYAAVQVTGQAGSFLIQRCKLMDRFAVVAVHRIGGELEDE